MIPTIDSNRAKYNITSIACLPDIINEIRKERGFKPTLVIRDMRIVEIFQALNYSAKLDSSKMLFKSINFSSATTPMMFQDALDGEIEKKQEKFFGPPGNCKLTVFFYNICMPFFNEWNDQIILGNIETADRVWILLLEQRKQKRFQECL